MPHDEACRGPTRWKQRAPLTGVCREEYVRLLITPYAVVGKLSIAPCMHSAPAPEMIFDVV